MQGETQSVRGTASALIMVVDDDERARESVAVMFMARGFRVMEHASGLEALQALQRGEPPDLILLDLVMPEMDGWELRRRLLVDELLADIPVVAMSGVCPARAPAIDASAFLAKPLVPADLLATVEGLIGDDREEAKLLPPRSQPFADPPAATALRPRHARAGRRARAQQVTRDPSRSAPIQFELQRERQMAQVSRALSHVVNNTLQSFMSSVECPVTNQSEAVELQQAAYASAWQCADLLRRFANCTRTDARELPAPLGTVPPWILEEWRQRCPAWVDLRVSGLSHLCPVRIPLDVLISVTDELLTNAIESLDEREGTVQVRVTQRALERAALRETLPIRNRRAGMWCCLEVIDDGPGIEAGQLGEIWSPFYSTKFAGRGLGLAEVLSHVGALGGLVEAESAAGRGTTVRLLFPLL